MTRLLVTGASGMLGRELVNRCRAEGFEVSGLDLPELDITGPAAAAAAVTGFDVVVNCAAWTAVDDAETKEPQAFSVNAVGPANLARGCADAGARLVQISTDYVFDGLGQGEYAEDAPTCPQGAYGRTKAAGEWAARALCPDTLIVRTAYLYGDGNCFPRTIANLLRTRDSITVVDDQFGQPTWTGDLAALILTLVRRQAPAGIYHGTSSGRASWFDFAVAVAQEAGIDPAKVGRTDTAGFPRPAPRPANSVLGHDALTAIGVDPIGDWRSRWAAAAKQVIGE